MAAPRFVVLIARYWWLLRTVAQSVTSLLIFFNMCLKEFCSPGDCKVLFVAPVFKNAERGLGFKTTNLL